MKPSGRLSVEYLNDILDAARKAMSFVDGVSYEQFRNNDEKLSAVIRKLEVIGEAAKSIPAVLRKRYPSIPWRSVSGMRDKLIHAYFGVDLERVWETVRDDLPPLIETIETMLGEDPHQELP